MITDWRRVTRRGNAAVVALALLIAETPASAGRIDVYPGADVATSGTAPMPTAWWLRPVSSAERVGAQSEVVWNRV